MNNKKIDLFLKAQLLGQTVACVSIGVLLVVFGNWSVAQSDKDKKAIEKTGVSAPATDIDSVSVVKLPSQRQR